MKGIRVMKTIETIMKAIPAAALLATGCANTATCDPNERLKEGMCFPKPAEAPPSDAAADGAGGPATCTEDAALTGEFGRKCTAHAECGCPAPVCAIQPGQTEGFCTQVCTNDPSVCPSGYRCIDLSAIDPSYPSTCLPSGLVP